MFTLDVAVDPRSGEWIVIVKHDEVVVHTIVGEDGDSIGYLMNLAHKWCKQFSNQ